MWFCDGGRKIDGSLLRKKEQRNGNRNTDEKTGRSN